MRVAGKAKKSFLKIGGRSGSAEGDGGIEGKQTAGMKDGDTIGEEFDFGKGMRREQQCGLSALQDPVFQELAEGCGGDSVEAARGFVEKQYARRV